MGSRASRQSEKSLSFQSVTERIKLIQALVADAHFAGIAAMREQDRLGGLHRRSQQFEYLVRFVYSAQGRRLYEVPRLPIIEPTIPAVPLMLLYVCGRFT